MIFILLNDLFLPFLNTLIKNKISNAESIVSIGFFRQDLKVLRLSLMLFIVSGTLLISMLTSTDNPIYQVLVLITYISMNVLLAMSIMFKFANEVSDRKLKFRTLSHIGFLDSAKSRIILKEVFYLYLFIVVSILIYLVNIFATLYLGGLLTMKTMLTLLIGSIIPICICGVISVFYYRSAVLKK